MTTILRFTALVLTSTCLVAAPRAAAQTAAPPFRVQLHVSGDDAVRAEALAHLTSALQRVRDVELTARDGEYVLSLVIVPTTAGGYAASFTVMTIYTAVALGNIAERVGVPAAARERFTAQFTGAGALLDQRVLTAADLNALCADAAGALNADVLGRERRFRGTAP